MWKIHFPDDRLKGIFCSLVLLTRFWFLFVSKLCIVSMVCLIFKGLLQFVA